MTKKIISVLLAAAMLFTGLVTTAFAADIKTTDEVKALIEAFDKDMTATEPDENTLKAYTELTEAFNALSDDDRNAFDVVVFGKLLCKVYDREIVLWKAENDSTSSASASKEAHERAKKVIKMPAYVEEAFALAVATKSITNEKQALELIEKLKTASLNAVILAGSFNSSYNMFRDAAKVASGSALIHSIANKLSGYTQKADAANKPVSPKYVSKPNVNKFEGEDDPKYIEAYKNYLAYKEAQADYYVANYEFEGEKHYLPALAKTVEAVPEFKYVYNLASAVIAAKREFSATKNTEAAKTAAALYNNLSEIQKAWIDSFSNNILGEKTVYTETNLGIEYTYDYFKLSELVAFCVSMEHYDKIAAFEKTVADVTEPYTNEDITVVKAAYNDIPSSLKNAVNNDTMAKYRDILAAVGPDTPSDENPKLDDYNVTPMPKTYLTEKSAETLADATVDLILGATGASDAKTLIYSGVFTNGTVLSLAKWLYPMLGDLSNLLECSPSKLAGRLDEEKFAGAAAALTAAGDDWEAVEIKNGDFGFNDGDVEGFLDAASAILRGASLIHVALKLQNTVSTSAGEYTYGAYEDLIPILEILDLKNVMSSHEYTEYTENAEITNDAKFRAILAPVAYLLVDFAENPVKVIEDILPKLAYAIDTGIVNDGVNNLLSKLKMVKVDPVDLTTSGIYAILKDKLLDKNNITLSEEDFSELITLLAGCGTAVAKPSIRRGYSYRLGIESDKAKAVVVLMDWLVGFASENKETAKTLIDMASNGDKLLSTALKIAFGVTAIPVPKAVTFTVVTTLIKIANLVSRINKMFGNILPNC